MPQPTPSGPLGRPTVLLQGDDAGDVYLSWRWIGPEPSDAHAAVIVRARLAPLLEELAASLPGSRPGESDAQMVERVLVAGAFASVERERALTARLGEALLPPVLAEQIVDKAQRFGPVHMRILSPPSCAAVPWELLPVGDSGRRLLEFVDITADPPPTFYGARQRHPDNSVVWVGPGEPGRPVIYVVDPETFVEDAVLGAEQRRYFSAARRRSAAGSPGPGDVFDRATLSRLLRADPAPSRLFYLGHVASGTDDPAATSMLLSDRKRTYGLVRPLEHAERSNRPLSAWDLMAGTVGRDTTEGSRSYGPTGEEITIWPSEDRDEITGAELWPMPPRVALVACNSGGDLAHPEPFGLVLALLGAGASLVTATRWTLPTDFAFRSVLGGTPQPLLDLALAVDASHDEIDPAAVLAAWQRERLAAWEATEATASPAADLSPIIWAALTTYVAPLRRVLPL